MGEAPGLRSSRSGPRQEAAVRDGTFADMCALDSLVLRCVQANDGISFAAINGRCPGGFRQADRALQRLRKAGLIESRKRKWFAADRSEPASHPKGDQT
jgi:hypothetical protein